MKLIFVALCVAVFIKLHDGSIFDKIRYLKHPHWDNNKIFHRPENIPKLVNNRGQVNNPGPVNNTRQVNIPKPTKSFGSANTSEFDIKVNIPKPIKSFESANTSEFDIKVNIPKPTKSFGSANTSQFDIKVNTPKPTKSFGSANTSEFDIKVNVPKPTKSFGSANTSELVIKEDMLFQKIDNFNLSDTREWKMRYLFNEQYFEQDGPIFIIVGGLYEISRAPLISGHFHDLAKKYKAFIFHTEHRYCGNSQLFLNLSTENLKYLTSRQALADLAHFIQMIKGNQRKFRNSKVILYGTAYAGSLVVWFRRLYPHLVNGGWASNAPILANIDATGFVNRIVTSVFMRSGHSCYNRLKAGITDLQQLFKTNQSDEAKKRLRLCDNFNGNSSLDVSSLFLSILNAVSHSVENNLMPATCDSALKNGEDSLTTVSNLIWDTFNEQGCSHVSYNDTVTRWINTTRLRLSYYQLCNEFGWFMVPRDSELFSGMIDLDFYIKSCQDYFGKNYDISYIMQRIEETNEIYGGLDPNVTNIYFTQGEVDPWRSLEKPDAVLIYGVLDDSLSIDSDDSLRMRSSKVLIDHQIGEWIK